jgi:type I restriction enzyme S subunit
MKPGYKQTEVGVIPEDWEVMSINDCCSYADYRGKTPPKTLSGTFLVTARNVRKGYIDYLESQEFVPSALYDQIMRRGKPQVGDVLITTEAPLGNVAQIDREDIALAQRIIKYRPKSEKLCSTYLKHYFLSERFQQILDDHSSGSTAKGIKGRVLHQLPVALPPLPEQRAIAGALSDVDALLGAQEALLAKKRDLKAAAMQQLLTGETRLPGFSGEWVVKRLGEVVDTDPENLASDTRPDFQFNYIALEDVDRGFLRSHSEQIFADAPSRARRKLRPNDVLVSTVRPNLQSHLLFKEDAGRWVCSTGFCVVRYREGVTHPGYVFFHLFAGCVNKQIDALLTGSNYPAINSGDVRALLIPFPPFAEQTAIAAVLSDMDAEIAALEAQRDKTRALKQGMMQELLTGRIRLL